MSSQSRLAWRCRRGTRELDTLLQRFLQSEFDSLNTEQQQIFDQFLDEPDPDIYNWITGHSELTDDKYLFLITGLRNIHSAIP